tara:strand:- start:38 stop:628 length:591 start_codon:yes stop_codon:yes gene_type:complete
MTTETLRFDTAFGPGFCDCQMWEGTITFKVKAKRGLWAEFEFFHGDWLPKHEIKAGKTEDLDHLEAAVRSAMSVLDAKGALNENAAANSKGADALQNDAIRILHGWIEMRTAQANSPVWVVAKKENTGIWETAEAPVLRTERKWWRRHPEGLVGTAMRQRDIWDIVEARPPVIQDLSGSGFSNHQLLDILGRARRA